LSDRFASVTSYAADRAAVRRGSGSGTIESVMSAHSPGHGNEAVQGAGPMPSEEFSLRDPGDDVGHSAPVVAGQALPHSCFRHAGRKRPFAL